MVIRSMITHLHQTDLIVDVISQLGAPLDADDIAVLGLDGVVDHVDHLLGLAGALHAHNQSDHSNHSCQLKSLGEIRYVKHTTRSREKQWRNEDSNFVHNGD